MIEFQGRHGPCYVNPNDVIAVSSYVITTGPNFEGLFKGSKVHLKGGGNFVIKEEAEAAIRQLVESSD